MSAWFHALVKDANDFDDPGLADAIVDDVHWMSDGAGKALAASMSQVEATDTRKKVVSISRGRALWVGCDLSHSHHQQFGVPPPRVLTPSLRLVARICSRSDCALRESRNRAIASATESGSSRDETRHVRVEVRLVNLYEVPTL